MTVTVEIKKHISFSELKDFYLCSHMHHLSWILNLIKFAGNEYTITGTAAHAVSAKLVLEEYLCRLKGETYQYNDEEIIAYYKSQFNLLIKEFLADKEKSKDLDRNNTVKVFRQCEGLYEKLLPKLKEQFGNYEVIESEHKLYQPIEGFDYNFKGFIDLILKLENGRYVIIDWKTCGWGWDARKKSSKEITYQLVYYKHFYAKEVNIDPEIIDTYFVLLKRTAKKDDNIEFVPVAIGSRKITNALEYMNKAVNDILLKKISKNKFHCLKCVCYRKHCQGV